MKGERGTGDRIAFFIDSTPVVDSKARAKLSLREESGLCVVRWM